MNSQFTDISRRDWFRLRKPSFNTDRPFNLGEHDQTGLQPIEEPVNHGQVNLASLPPMHEATLNKEDVSSLFADIGKHALHITLIARRTSGDKNDQSGQLAAACEQLLHGSVSRVQIRYEWENTKWIDTLERKPDGFRLVRIQHK